MAQNTSKTMRNEVMYQIFVRNFSESGKFEAVIPELDRIKELGVSIIWFAPIHPIGKDCRKGSLGSPYAISDYRKINPEYGTMEDFKKVVSEIHKRGMKCIIDVVYNHTSPDSVLAAEHPEWFYHKEDGSFGNHVGDWSDIIDLDYSNKDLWEYQIESLKMWAEIVDGFRCDVAPLIPLEFWKKARREVEECRPGCIWLSESVEPEFITYMREMGLNALSDSEIFQAFDISYEYDVYSYLTDYLTGKRKLNEYSEAINRQEYIYPDNYVKLRFLENHDQPRAHFLFPDTDVLINATAFLYFQKGMTLIYAGQEFGEKHLPGLFDKDYTGFNDKKKVHETDLSNMMKTLSEIKKNAIFTDSHYKTKALGKDIIVAEHKKGNRSALGVFSLSGKDALIPIYIPDGIYRNEIDGSGVEVCHSLLSFKGKPIIILL
ncbi:MAG: alpha-amylase [Butyrivibrio sp.]|nr:alpha-amylase [Butyrivibrio sp.]